MSSSNRLFPLLAASYPMSFLSSSRLGTFPATLTSPSTASAGVIITPKPMISWMSLIFTSSYSIPSDFAASSVSSASFLHFGHPVPRICSFFIAHLEKQILHYVQDDMCYVQDDMCYVQDDMCYVQDDMSRCIGSSVPIQTHVSGLNSRNTGALCLSERAVDHARERRHYHNQRDKNDSLLGAHDLADHQHTRQ